VRRRGSGNPYLDSHRLQVLQAQRVIHGGLLKG
jgi:hypothetical protein